MPDSNEQAIATFIRNIEAKTGQTIAQWVVIARKAGSKHGEMVKALKAQHDLSHGYANFIALRALEAAAGPAASTDPVDALYTGDKAALRPVHDKLAQATNKLGADVVFAPKKGYVSVRRQKQFAALQPSTATRFDLGLILKGTPPSGRLEAAGSFNAMFTHRVRLAAAKDVDKEVLGWLKQAYEAAG